LIISINNIFFCRSAASCLEHISHRSLALWSIPQKYMTQTCRLRYLLACDLSVCALLDTQSYPPFTASTRISLYDRPTHRPSSRQFIPFRACDVFLSELVGYASNISKTSLHSPNLWIDRRMYCYGSCLSGYPLSWRYCYRIFAGVVTDACPHGSPSWQKLPSLCSWHLDTNSAYSVIIIFLCRWSSWFFCQESAILSQIL
jgi:hypothetical protein